MDLADKGVLQHLLREYRLRPKKGMGQHFLVDRTVLEEIINAADLKKTDTVLEVGPGLGTLTIELARRVKKVITVEKDARLVAVLNDILAQEKIANVEIIEGDILQEVKSQKLKVKSINKVVADIPYYLTARLLRLLLDAHSRHIAYRSSRIVKNDKQYAIGDKPGLIVLLVQKEVAERICAKPPHMSLLAVSVQYFVEPKIAAWVSRTAFWPIPEVDSAILRLVQRKNANIDAKERELFFEVVRAGFRQPRKLLISNLKSTLGLSNDAASRFFLAASLPPAIRAQELSMEQWQKLAQAYTRIRAT